VVNADASSYEDLWKAVLAIDLDGNRIELTLREWINSGLMTFLFFVLGLEARREFDLGALGERRRFVLPLFASVGGMGAAAAIYLAFNLESLAAEGWGIAMSTDTAFALGLLTLQEGASSSSASSPRPSSSTWPAKASGPRSRPTSACSSSITRGRAT
jgi:Na+/H+ antiporter NhaA